MNVNPLFLAEANRIERAIDNGEITDPAVIKKLVDSGMVRSLDRMVAGINTGVKNVANKNNVRINPINNALQSGYMDTRYMRSRPTKTGNWISRLFVPDSLANQQSTINIKKFNDKETGLEGWKDAITRYHEAREIARGNGRLQKKLRDEITKASANRHKGFWGNLLHIFDRMRFDKHAEKIMAPHGHHVGVINDETKLLNSLKRRYGHIIGKDDPFVRSDYEHPIQKMTARQDYKARLNALRALQRQKRISKDFGQRLKDYGLNFWGKR